MYKALSPGAIGVRVANLEEAIAAAQRHGFGGVEFSPAEVATRIEREGVEAVRAKFEQAGVKPAAFGLPTDWRTTEENWRKGLEELPRLAKAAAAIGGGRTMTWILSCAQERNYDQNWDFHVQRFRPIADILGEHGCTLGLEFLGPKTLREMHRFAFIYTPQAMLAMGREIGTNVGLLLDCWHWHTSGGTVADLHALTAEQVVYIHVNDAPAGVGMDEYVDNVRGLPGETGVIDIAGFLQALQAIGYEGPVTAEPFKKELSDLPDDEARLATVAAAMKRIFQQAGLP